MTVKQLREYLEEYDENDILLTVEGDYESEYNELDILYTYSELMELGINKDNIFLTSDLDK